MRKLILIAVMMTSIVGHMNSQDKKSPRIPLIGEDAPSFTANSTNGEINFPKDFGNSWKIIFSHPKDFTPVCSSELLELAQQQNDYEQLNTKILVLSTDILSQHVSWKSALEEVRYKDRETEKIRFPLIDDSNLTISNQYGMIHPSVNIAENVRAVFIIDPKNKIRFINFYPMQVGRNMDEIKRTLQAMQTADAGKNIVIPANWNPGDDVMVPFLTESEKRTLQDQNSDLYQVSWFMLFRKTR